MNTRKYIPNMICTEAIRESILNHEALLVQRKREFLKSITKEDDARLINQVTPYTIFFLPEEDRYKVNHDYVQFSQFVDRAIMVNNNNDLSMTIIEIKGYSI